MPYQVKAELLTRGTFPNEKVVPYRISVPGYNPELEEIGMNIVGALDELEKRGFKFAGETIGPFVIATDPPHAPQLIFAVRSAE